MLVIVPILVLVRIVVEVRTCLGTSACPCSWWCSWPPPNCRSASNVSLSPLNASSCVTSSTGLKNWASHTTTMLVSGAAWIPLGHGRAQRMAVHAWGERAYPEYNLWLSKQCDDTLYWWAAFFTTLNLVDHDVSFPLVLWQRLFHPLDNSPHCCSPGLVDYRPARLERNHCVQLSTCRR